MQTIRNLMLLAACLAALTGCFEEGSGVYATREVNLDNFAAIDVKGDITRVSVRRCDCQPYAVISGDDNLISDVDLRFDDGMLDVDVDGWIEPNLPLVVELYGPGVHHVEVSGDGNVEVHEVQGDRFEGDVSGDGRIAVSGSIDHAVLKVSGDGEIEAYRLKAYDARVKISGDGHVETCVQHILDVDISGDGLAEYACDPVSVKSDISGDGRLKARPEPRLTR